MFVCTVFFYVVYMYYIYINYKAFCSPSLIQGKKNYDHTVNKLGCPRPGLTTSNARPSFKPLYVLFKHCTSNNKVLEQSWGHLTSLKLWKITLFSNLTPIPYNNINSQGAKTILAIRDFTILRHVNTSTIESAIYTHSTHTRLQFPPKKGPGNT